jgi:hypothetical protein
MEISPKQKEKAEKELQEGIQTLKKHLKTFKKNELVKLAINHIIEIEDLKGALKYYYEKYEEQEKAELMPEESKND